MSEIFKHNAVLSVQAAVQAADQDGLAILETQSLNFGLTKEEVEHVLSKYGPGTLSIVIELLRNGLTASTVLQILSLYGSPVVEWLVRLLVSGKEDIAEKEKSLLGDNLIGGIQADFTRVIVKLVADKVLPVVVDAYGQQILQSIVKSIQTAVDDPKLAGQIDNAIGR
jgi:hypothetical protein